MKFLNIKTHLITLFLSFVLATNCFAVVVETEEAGDYAEFIFSIFSLSQTSGGTLLCIIGSDEISKVITARDKTAITLTLDEMDDKRYSTCKAVYVSQGSEKTSKSEMERLIKRKVMTIAVFDGFVETGGMMQVQMGRRGFEIILNSKEVKTANVRLNALLLSLVIN